MNYQSTPSISHGFHQSGDYHLLDERVNYLMDMNQAMAAWELVKDTNYPKKDRVYLKVKHAFEPDAYRDFYANHLPETPLPENLANNIWAVFPRYWWLKGKLDIQKPRTLFDVGCADGYLCLSASKLGIQCVGINLHRPSINVARSRALGTTTEFIWGDFMDHKGKYDAVVFFEVLEHVPDPKAAIKKLMSFVNPGGRLYISTPRTDHLGIELHLAEKDRKGWNDGLPSGHLKLFTEQELRDLLKDYNLVDLQLDAERCMLAEIKNGV